MHLAQPKLWSRVHGDCERCTVSCTAHATMTLHVIRGVGPKRKFTHVNKQVGTVPTGTAVQVGRKGGVGGTKRNVVATAPMVPLASRLCQGT